MFSAYLFYESYYTGTEQHGTQHAHLAPCCAHGYLLEASGMRDTNNREETMAGQNFQFQYYDNIETCCVCQGCPPCESSG